jgi:glycerol-3-phosphate dehydrogenase
MAVRQQLWDALGTEHLDLLVIGGGITGSGIARDGARRGLKTAAVEMADLASGTSSRSSKLVHGGLRYLEMGELSLVFEAVSERRILMDIAPHLVNPQGFLFPVYRNSRRKRWMVNGGIWVYDALSLFRSPKLHQNLDAAAVAKEEPLIKQDGLDGAPLYYDCATDDARLTLETALDAVQAGAVVVTYAKAVELLVADGRVAGAVIEDVRTGARKPVHASVVVNATGPWTDRTLAMSKAHKGTLLRPTKGVHVVVPRDKLPLTHAVVIFHPKDGRVLFALPWGDRSYIGTTDTDYTGDPADVAADKSDVVYLVDAANAYFPKHQLVPSDVIATWAGLRPLVAPSGEGVGESQVSREHTILVGTDNLVTIAGGKLTTYRRMAAEIVDTVTNLLRFQNKLPKDLTASRTAEEPLPGAVGWPADDDASKVAAQIQAACGAIADSTADYLANRYGMRGIDIARLVAADDKLAKPLIAGRPEILAQVDWAVDREMAATVSDFMIRRTQLYFRDVDQGLGAIGVVADRMAKKLGWDKAAKQASSDEYRAEVARSRRWKDG